MKFKILVLSIFCSQLVFSNSQLDSLFKEANRQYQDEMYAESVENYLTILDSNFTSYELYFNLANSYYQFGKIPLSIYYYEKALEFQNGEDAKNNLLLAQSRITLIDPIPQLFYVSWWNTISRLLSKKQWAMFLIIMTWLTSIILLFFIKSRKRWVFNSLFSGILLSAMIAGQMYTNNILVNQKFGIVMKQAKLFDDSKNYNSKGSVDRGNKVTILKKSENLIWIRLQDGEKAWIESSLVKILD